MSFFFPGFLTYTILVVIISLILMYYFGPRYGNTNMIIYIVICSIIGSLSVMACKGIGVAILETASGLNQFTNWLTWFCIISLILTVSVQMNYLNKALDIYNTPMVAALYYVFFTSAVLTASAILFRELQSMSATNLIGVFTGFVIIICAIFLMNVFKDHELTLITVREYIRNATPSQSSLLPSDDVIAYVDQDKKYEHDKASSQKKNYESISDDKGSIYFSKAGTSHDTS